MKNLLKLKWILLLAVALLTTQACEKDDFIDSINNNDQQENIDDDQDDDATDSNDDDSYDDDNSDEDGGSGDEGEITSYTLKGNDLVKQKDYTVTGSSLEFQKDTAKHQEIWGLVKKIVPPAYLAKLSEFIIFAGEDSGTAGYVVETKTDLSKWKMGIAIDYAYENSFNADGELAYTIIHEFGHILTLDNLQLDASISQSDCTNYYPGEGCAKTDSYINKLHKNYWADIWGEFQGTSEEGDKQDFYTKYQDRFVTDYASTNPGEDIAEVFATFVTRNGGVNGTSIKEQKIQLMYDHTQLVELRNFIRNNMASAKGRSFLPAEGAWKRAKTIGKNKKGCSHGHHKNH